jgi:hypothetical protein
VILESRVVNSRLVKPRKDLDRRIRGGSQPSISSKVQFQNRGIIEEEEWLLVVRSSPESRKLVGDKWRVLVALEESTFVDISCFGYCKNCGIASRTSNS